LSGLQGLAPQVAALVAEGRRLLDAGMAADAIDLLTRATAAAPDDAESARWLAEAHLAAGSSADAGRVLDAALARTPSSAQLIVLRSEAAQKQSDLGGAEAMLDAAIDAAPDNAELLAQRARTHLLAGEAAAGMAAVERSLALDPSNLEAQSLRIVLASYEPAVSTERLKALQRAWPAPPPDQARSGDAAGWPHRQGERRPLRVGYVSCAFYRHPVAQVAGAVLLGHDPAKVEVHCYSGSRRRDEVSVKLRMAARGWRTITGLTDAEAAARIRADGIDILVDLDGHFPHNRLGVFARRAAPVQASAWGYVPGPGIGGIDYLLTDPHIAPDPEAGLFPERLVRLSCAQPYAADLMPRPPASAAPLERAPGPIRFGCFNRLDKLTDATLALWGEVLRAAPEASLTLKDRFFAEPARQARIAAALTAAGAAAAQLRFERDESHGAYLAAFDRIDVALDPLPVSGGVTTLDGLMQGVPAITLAGAAPTGRITASILAHAGLADAVCASREAYVRTAVALARDPARLADLRGRTLAARTRFSPAAMRGYAAEVEAAYAEMWGRHMADTRSGRRAE